jgi:D-alanyl-D-alanine carboxypeptidase/D-alanyl-D-alanine-endopeptidase (penicillin-binding protein 4)
MPGQFTPVPRGRVMRAVFFGLVALACRAQAADSLPDEVGVALAAANVPPDAVVAMVQELGADQPLLTWQVDKPVNPASMTKLLTTYAGLELLGRGWSWATPVWLQGAVHDGVLDGDLVIKGSGDPTLVMERVWLLLRRVRQFGVREIRGDIVLDRSSFVVPDTSPAAFDGEGLRPYNVQADALMLGFKSVVLTFTPDAARGIAVVSADPPLAGVHVDTSVPLSGAPCEDWYTGLGASFTDPARIALSGTYSSACAERSWAVAYVDPNAFNGRALLGLWQEMGGRLGGVVRDGVAPATPPSFAATSPSLTEVVRDIDKFSNNVMAQQLFLTLGLAQRGSGSPEASREVLGQWAAERFGAAADGLVIDNGSGLSRDTRVSARLLTRVLVRAWADPVMPEFISALSVAGVDGTLKDSDVIPGRAHLKTGTLRGVSGIAGYVLADSGRRCALVIIANHDNAAAARPVFDALVRWTAARCGAEARSGERAPVAGAGH